MNEGFYLPKETKEKLWGDMDLTASLTLSVPEYEKVGKSVESKLNNILSRHPDLVMETLQEVKASSANTIHNITIASCFTNVSYVQSTGSVFKISS